jgi:hypothetical protein
MRSTRRLRTTIATHDAEIARWLDGPPQTNETGAIRRADERLARFGRTVPRSVPFDVLEIGSSAGLNLMLDRYDFDLGGVRVGPDDSPKSGSRPSGVARCRLPQKIAIRGVRGVDIAPIDLTDEDAGRAADGLCLGRPARCGSIELTRAIAMARADPPLLECGDAADWIESRLAEPQPDGT